jgi:S-adenosylmethionine hydrolase
MAIVTLTTDFGTADGYVGAMKGVLLSLAPDATLVDVTHDVPARDVTAGAFALATAVPLYPAGSIHVAVVDPGVGGPRLGVVVEAGGALFVGPDNGLLCMAARGPRAIFRIENPAFKRDLVSATFHGRDVFAMAAGRLANGRPASEAGPVQESLQELSLPWHGVEARGRGEIIHVDAFGNLITSFAGEIFAPGDWQLRRSEASSAQGIALVAGRTYADVAPGQLVLYVGSGGRLEIGVRDGSAAKATGLGRGDHIVLVRAS